MKPTTKRYQDYRLFEAALQGGFIPEWPHIGQRELDDKMGSLLGRELMDFRFHVDKVGRGFVTWVPR